jgi:hypothetical protein
MLTKVSKNLFIKPLKPLIFATCLVSMTSCSENEIKRALCAFLGSAVGVCVAIVWPPSTILDEILRILGAGGAGWATFKICEGLLIREDSAGNVTPMLIDGRQPSGLLITTHCDENGKNCEVVSLDFAFGEETEDVELTPFEGETEANEVTHRDSAAGLESLFYQTGLMDGLKQNEASTIQSEAKSNGGIPAPATCDQLGTCNSTECCAKYQEACNSDDARKLRRHKPDFDRYLCKTAVPLECRS